MKMEKEYINFVDSPVYKLHFKEKLEVIREVVKKIRGNKKVMSKIAKIKAHEWVKVIEGDEK